jgi:hypothetical protein
MGIVHTPVNCSVVAVGRLNEKKEVLSTLGCSFELR